MKKMIILSLLFILILASISFGESNSAKKIIWNKKADLPSARRNGAAMACNGKIYYVGGYAQPSIAPLNTIFEYDPGTDTWEKKSAKPTKCSNLALATIDAKIYAIGGDPFLNKNEVYNPSADSWESKASMPTKRQHVKCGVVNGKIYVMGGLTSWSHISVKNECYDPATDTWEEKAPLPVPRHGPNPNIAVLNGIIYVIGGYGYSQNDIWAPLTTVQAYDPTTDQWSLEKEIPSPYSLGAIVLNQTLYILTDESDHTKIYTYDPAMHSWNYTDSTQLFNQQAGIAAINNVVYYIGGNDSDFTAYPDVFEGKLELPDPNGPIENLTSGQRFNSVQCAIYYADNGDEIVLSPGTYQENIDLLGKDLILRSVDPNNPSVIEETIIQGDGTKPVITLDKNSNQCILKGLTITGGLVGLDLQKASPQIEYCRIIDNAGHGIDMQAKSEPTISHTLICANDGVGISMTPYVDIDFNIINEPEFINCTIAQNTEEGIKGGIVSLRNCIVYGNGTGQISPVSATVNYSCVAGGFNGPGNIDADPLFAELAYLDPNGTPDDPNDDFQVPGDYHLKSQAGRYDPNSADWVLDDVTSPCIDAGDPNTPVGQEPSPHGDRVNMGAYGGTCQASKS
jgi:N-acetylneuraminic acid mutarotase